MVEDFAAWLAKQLDKKDISDSKFAKRIGVSHTSVRNWTTGVLMPRPDNCRRIADALGIPRDEVLRRAGYLSPELDDDLDITADELQALNLIREAKGKAPITYLPDREQSIDGLIAEVRARRPDMDLSFLEEAKEKMSERMLCVLLQSILCAAHGSPEETAAFVDLQRKISQVTSLKRTPRQEKIDRIMEYLSSLDDDELARVVKQYGLVGENLDEMSQNIVAGSQQQPLPDTG